MAKYLTHIIEKKEIAQNTLLFSFEKPLGFEYESGQAVDVKLIEPQETDEKGNIRSFSLVSSPTEPRISIATRLGKSSFKKNLKNNEIGSEVEIIGAFGDLRLPEKKSEKIIMLTGGIGITPFISMLRFEQFKNEERDITLIFSNKNIISAPFYNELLAIKQKKENIKIIFTFTDEDFPSVFAEKGRISWEMIGKHIKESHHDYKYFITGPVGLVESIKSILIFNGVGNTNIFTEKFTGYT